MNMKPFLGILLMGIVFPVLATQASEERSSGGSIQLRDEIPNEGTKTCNLPVGPAGSGQTRIYELPAGENPCRAFLNKTDEIYFSELPSAVQILLTDSMTCKNAGNENFKGTFWIKLKTTLKFTSPESMSMQYFFSQTKGTIIKPGLLLVDYYLKGEPADAIDRLGCVKVVTSRATLPKPIEWPDLEYRHWIHYDNDLGFDFRCQTNQVMTGAGRAWDADKPYIYRCAMPMLNGSEATVKNYRQSVGNTGDNHYFVCPINTVMAGLKLHQGSWYTCAEVWLGDTRLEVAPDESWSDHYPIRDYIYSCASGKVIIARYFVNGEELAYRCGKLFLPSPP